MTKSIIVVRPTKDSILTLLAERGAVERKYPFVFMADNPRENRRMDSIYSLDRTKQL